MEKGAFYITLPSNASQDLFPGNRIADYSVKLAKPVELKGCWEVALTEIQYPHTWNTLSKKDAKFTAVRERPRMVFEGTFPAGYYHSVGAVVEAINDVLKETTHYTDLRLYHDNVQRKTFYRGHEDHTAFITYGKLNRVLGNVQNRQRPDYLDRSCSDVHGGFYTLFLYADMVQHQRVGDSYAPLLRCVQVSGENNSIVCMQYIKPEYLPVSKSHFDTISLQIRDDQGNIVSFKYGKVIVKLHFRPSRVYD